MEVDGTNGVGAFRKFGVASVWHIVGYPYCPLHPGSRSVLGQMELGALQITVRWVCFPAAGLVCISPLPLFFLFLSFPCSRLFMFKHVLCRHLSRVAGESTTAWFPLHPPLQGLWPLSSMTIFPGLQEDGSGCQNTWLARFCLVAAFFSPSRPAPPPTALSGHFRSGIWATDIVFP